MEPVNTIHRPYRRPGAGDFAALLSLLENCGLPTTDLTLASLAHFRVARDGDRISAVAGLVALGHVGLLRSVAVAPAQRGQGLASGLVDTLEQEARRLGLTTLYLLTSSAGEFFGRRGYQVIPREEAPAAIRDSAEFTRLCPATALCMRKALAAPP
jgi:amino-acid N-acetyltransferase